MPYFQILRHNKKIIFISAPIRSFSGEYRVQARIRNANRIVDISDILQRNDVLLQILQCLVLHFHKIPRTPDEPGTLFEFQPEIPVRPINKEPVLIPRRSDPNIDRLKTCVETIAIDI